MRRRRTGWLGACIVVCAAGLAIPAQAADDAWAFEITPYFWGCGIDGRVGIAPLPPADLDMSFSDIMDNFESGFAIFGTARKGPWLGAGDFSYVDTETTENLPQARVKLGNKSTIAKLIGGYRIPGEDRPVQADLYGGARYMRFETELDVSGVGSADRTEDWVDPLVGVNLVWPFAEKWRANLMADIGGFGVGSDLAWEVMPIVQYQFNRTFSAKLAYRWLDVDYEEDDYTSDTLTHGWLAGLGIAF